MGDNFDHLEDLVIPTDVFEYAGKRMKVRGLSVPHISAIIRSNRDTLADFYFKAVAGVLPAETEAIVQEALISSDRLIPMVIAHGIGKGTEKEIQIAADLPFAAQVVAVDKIIRLTVATEGGVGKLVEIVAGALSAAQVLATPKT